MKGTAKGRQKDGERKGLGMKKMGLVALTVLLCLPMGALAVREGVIEDAPMVEARRKTSYLPMHRVVVEETGWMLEEAYTEIDTREMSYDDIRANLTSNCRLTTGERKRMEKLMAAYAAGERTGDGASVLEAKQNVRVGVYALDPAEYDGERVLLLLAFLGGGAGAFFGMTVFRHKTKHIKFIILVPLSILLHLAVWQFFGERILG